MNEQEKIKYRNIFRETHLIQCNKEKCSNPLGRSMMEKIPKIDQLKKINFDHNFSEDE